jgi:hypothetical protein
MTHCHVSLNYFMNGELYSNVFHLEKHNLRQRNNYSFDSLTNVPANQITQLIHSRDIRPLYFSS